MMAETIDGASITAAVERVADQLEVLRDPLNQLDAAVGDGDLGITVSKGAGAMREYLAANSPADDLGKFLGGLGMAFNRAASSTMGALIATALMRAGREAREMAELDAETLAKMLHAADVGIQERGKAKPGDKTIVDALHPASEAFSAAVEAGESLDDAAARMLAAARAGRDAVTPLRSKIGRASWVGERTENQPDPGTVLFVRVVETVLGAPYSEQGSSLTED
jgi:dihydroxyacetone kinase-like protein